MSAIRGRRHGERPTLPVDVYGAEEGGTPGEFRDTASSHLRTIQQIITLMMDHRLSELEELKSLGDLRRLTDAALDIVESVRSGAASQTSVTVKRNVLDRL